MADGTPIPGPALLTRAVEASAANYEAAFTAGWNALHVAIRRELETATLFASTAAYLEPRQAFAMAKDFLLRRLDALAKESPDANR